jgi:hypothetical protein
MEKVDEENPRRFPAVMSSKQRSWASLFQIDASNQEGVELGKLKPEAKQLSAEG